MQELEKLEEDRLVIAKKLKSSIFVIILISLVISAIIYTQTYNLATSIIFAGLLGLIGYAVYKSNLTREFNYKFKNSVIRKIIQNINENLVYEPSLYMSLSDFNRTNIYKFPDTYSGNDLIYGKIKGVDIKFSDIYSQERVETVDEKGNTHVSYKTIFSGIFFIADFHKKFSSQTYVLSNKFGFKFGSRAHMDNSEFEDEFRTYTDDQINARYILTPNLMEQILKTKELFNCPLNIAFLDNQIYIYIEFNKDSFEPDIFQTLLGENSIVLKYKREISNLINLVEELNLNTKIWG
ncbi:MAG: DUF3137 domain-containing protein [Campylobacteraceae bacterium]|nr:DUF3137 domain-containing protein [Campylobacteraceae bacterium]